MAFSTSAMNFIAPGRQPAFGFQFGNDFGAGQHMLGTVDLGQHQRRYTRNDRRLQIAHQQPPRPVDPHQHIGAVARNLRDGALDQRPRMRFLRRRDRVFQIQNDRVGATIGAGADEFFRRHRNEHQGPPHRQIVAHCSALLDHALGRQRGQPGGIIADRLQHRSRVLPERRARPSAAVPAFPTAAG